MRQSCQGSIGSIKIAIGWYALASRFAPDRYDGHGATLLGLEKPNAADQVDQIAMRQPGHNRIGKEIFHVIQRLLGRAGCFHVGAAISEQ